MAVFPKECPREQCDVDPPHQAAPDARPRNGARRGRRSPWKQDLRLSVYTGVSGSTERRKTRPLLRAGRKPALMSREAVVRWLLLLLVGLVDWVWMGWAGFRIGPGVVQSIGFISLLILISIFYFYTARDDRIMHFAHFGAQYLALFAVLTVLSYLAVSTNAPLVDPEFDAIDKALGLDWLAWTEWVVGHPVLRKGLLVAYASLPLQALFGYIYNVHSRANWRNTEIWWITFVSALTTISISAFVPAISAWVYYGLSSMADFPHMQHFEAMRDGTMRLIGFTDAQGWRPEQWSPPLPSGASGVLAGAWACVFGPSSNNELNAHHGLWATLGCVSRVNSRFVGLQTSPSPSGGRLPLPY